MDDLILILSKSLLIFLGIFIMSISNKFSFNFLLPDKNKFIVLNKKDYFKCIQRTVKLLGIIFIWVGIISFLNRNIYYFLIISIPLLILNMNKNLTKFYLC
jgi:hypothetical protein